MRRNAIYAALLAAACLVVFAPAYSAGITNWDDDIYLRSSVFTTYVMGNFHPLTMLSFVVSGHNPIALHATNVALHAITAILLFFLIVELSGSQFPAFVGALIWYPFFHSWGHYNEAENQYQVTGSKAELPMV